MPGKPYTAEERRKRRQAGILSWVIIDGRAYISGLTGGITTAGTSGRILRESGYFLRRIAEVEAKCKNAAFVRTIYECAGLPCPADPEPRLAVHVNGWGVVDGRTDRLLYPIQF